MRAYGVFRPLERCGEKTVQAFYSVSSRLQQGGGIREVSGVSIHAEKS